ncbi:unnamed protein product, partial [Choristocarpus tenellus]
FSCIAEGEQGSLCIVTELLSRGSLFDVIGDGGLREASYGHILSLALQNLSTRSLHWQAARGMMFLHCHSPPICHRDLKSSNLVVDERWHVKVTDFGMSRFIPERYTSQVAMVQETSAKQEVENAGSRMQAHQRCAAKTVEEAGAMATGGWTEQVEGAAGLEQPLVNTSTTVGRRLSQCHPLADEGGRVRGEGEQEGGWLKGSRDSSPGSQVGRVGARQEDVLDLTTNLGTVAWAAPEMFSAEGRSTYTSKASGISWLSTYC